MRIQHKQKKEVIEEFGKEDESDYDTDWKEFLFPEDEDDDWKDDKKFEGVEV